MRGRVENTTGRRNEVERRRDAIENETRHQCGLQRTQHLPEEVNNSTISATVRTVKSNETTQEHVPGADPNWRPCEVAPLEAFDDELAQDGLAAQVQPDYLPETGRGSSTVRAVFASRCCGYVNPPTAEELYDAMRRDDPNERDRQVLAAWVIEATERDWLLAWTEQAYSWRMLARAVAISEFPCWERIRNLNMVAKKPELVPREWLPVRE